MSFLVMPPLFGKRSAEVDTVWVALEREHVPPGVAGRILSLLLEQSGTRADLVELAAAHGGSGPGCAGAG